MQHLLYSLAVGLALVCAAVPACKKNVQKANPCDEVPALGHLKHPAASGTFSFTTTGGGHIAIDNKGNIIITHDQYAGFSIEFWGGNLASGVFTAEHENLNGTHIKDRLSANRTLLFPDGAKMTLVTDGATGRLRAISIYDGAENHRINFDCRSVERSSLTLADSRQQDAAEPDGEAGGFEITATGLLYFNQYTEETAGNKVTKYYLLGSLEKDKPNMVNDYF